MLLVVFLGVSVMGNTLTLEFRYRLGVENVSKRQGCLQCMMKILKYKDDFVSGGWAVVRL